MIELIFIELFSVLAFVYTALLMVMKVGSGSEMMIALAGSTVLGLIVVGLSKKVRWLSILSMLSLSGIFYFDNISGIIFFTVQGLVLLAYTASGDTIEELEIKFVVKSALTYLIVSTVIFWTLKDVFLLTGGGAMKVMWPFFVMFLMSSVMYLRSVRHIDGKLDHKKIRKSNIRYIFMMIGVYLVILFSDFKDEVSDLEDYIKDVAGFLLKPVYKILGVFNMDMDVEAEGIGEGIMITEELEELDEAAKAGIEAYQDQTLSDDGQLQTFVYILAACIVAVVMFFVIRKLIRDKRQGDDGFKPEVEEVRTFIKNDKKSGLSKFFRNFGAKTPKEQIRASYRKHIDFIEREDDILESDTTYDIQEKADDLGFEYTKEIRNTYAHVRYGDNEPSNEMVQELKKIVK